MSQENDTVPAAEYQRALEQVDAVREKMALLEQELVVAKSNLRAVASWRPDSEFNETQNVWRKAVRVALETRGWVSTEDVTELRAELERARERIRRSA